MQKTTWMLALGLNTVLGCSGSGTSTTAQTSTATATDGATTDAATETAEGTGTTASAPTTTGDAEATDGPQTSDPQTGETTLESTTDATTSGDTGSSDTGVAEVSLEGTWVSEGDNIAPLLVDLTGATSITATFDATTFTVLTVDDMGQETTQSGVYSATPSGVGEIYDILLDQSTPTTVTAEGIFELDGSTNPPTMRYEVIQTIPDVGAVAPTADGGFGSTAYGDDLTQVFVLQ